MVGIVNFGYYIPEKRIKVADLAAKNGRNGEEIEKALKVFEKSAPAEDEDTATMAVEAGFKALDGLKPSRVGAVFVGSESHPYAVKPTATIVGEALGIGPEYFAADLEFACKAGTAGAQVIAGLLAAGKIDYGLAIGADCAQAAPGDALEYTAAAGAAALLLGRRKRELVATIDEFCSFTSDTADFWRRGGQAYPSHAGRFTGEPSYFTHVVGATRLLLAKTKLKPKNIDYVVFHMPNGKFPLEAAKRLGFEPAQLEAGFVAPHVGNPYSASSLLGLCKVLEVAKPGQKILMTSYGSGAGSDSFLLTMKQ